MKNQKSLYRRAFTLIFSLSLLLSTAQAQPAPQKSAQDESTEPFRIAYNLYYVGSREIGSYLVVTPEGDILINCTNSVEQLQTSIEKLGFKITDVKILLLSNSREEIAGGCNVLFDLTHAKLMVMDGDVEAVESRNLKVDRILHDRDFVQLGGFELLAYKTAGFTPGATTWTMQPMSKGELRNVIILSGLQVEPGIHLVNLPHHPAAYKGIAEDYEKSFLLLRQSPEAIFLSAYSRDFNLITKVEKFRLNGDEDIWFDPKGFKDCLAERRRAFRKILKSQESLLPPVQNY